jgi:GntR family galactonate operon transcriptional repressor
MKGLGFFSPFRMLMATDLLIRVNIRRESLHAQVARKIGIQILKGAGTEGSGLQATELSLSRDLRVSRPTLREALKVLAAKGLVEVRQKTGIHVRPRSEWNLLDPAVLCWFTEAGMDQKFASDLYGIRLVLEPAAAATAALEASDEETRSIQNLFKEMERSTKDFEKYVRADLEFHQAITRATRNELLLQINQTIFRALQEVLHRFFWGHSVPIPPVESQSYWHKTTLDAIGLHREVANAIVNRDADAARSAMFHLVQQAKEQLTLILQERSARNEANSQDVP